MQQGRITCHSIQVSLMMKGYERLSQVCRKNASNALILVLRNIKVAILPIFIKQDMLLTLHEPKACTINKGKKSKGTSGSTMFYAHEAKRKF